ncbi:glycosyltransferase family 29 protein [Pseudoscourfieldia marina]
MPVRVLVGDGLRLRLVVASSRRSWRPQPPTFGVRITKMLSFLLCFVHVALTVLTVACGAASASASTSPPSLFDLELIKNARVVKKPFAHFVIPQFVKHLEHINRDFPPSLKTKAHVDEVELAQKGEIYGEFDRLLKQLKSLEFRNALETAFDVSLANTFTRVSMRGVSWKMDGRIHADDASKRVSVLVYLNEEWTHGDGDGGKLRLLRSRNIDDYEVQVDSYGGNLLAFKNPAAFQNKKSGFHGYKLLEGDRRAIQVNYQTRIKMDGDYVYPTDARIKDGSLKLPSGISLPDGESSGEVSERPPKQTDGDCSEVAFEKMLKYTLDRIDATKVDYKPFAHMFVRNVFSESLYACMLNALPTPEQTNRYHAMKKNNRFYIRVKGEGGSVQRVPNAKKHRFWASFAKTFMGDDIRNRWLRKFEPSLAARFGDLEVEISSGQFEHRLDLARDGKDYGITPHTDSNEKALTILYYLPRDDSAKHVGTSTFLSRSRIEDGGFGMTYGSDWKNSSIAGEFEEVNTAPFLPNSAFIFAPCQSSWHAVRPIGNAARDTLQAFITVRALHNKKVRTYFADKAKGKKVRFDDAIEKYGKKAKCVMAEQSGGDGAKDERVIQPDAAAATTATRRNDHQDGNKCPSVQESTPLCQARAALPACVSGVFPHVTSSGDLTMVASGADAFRDTPWGASLSDASLQGLPPHGIHGPAGFQVFRTCALVSSSSAMAKSGLGREIDQHDVVMRINNAPVRGFEDDVGSKTTLRYTNNYSEGFREQENETVVAGKWCIHGPPCKSRDLKRLNEKKVHVMHPSFAKEYAQTPYFRDMGHGPTSGFLSMLFLAHNCASISMYGFGVYDTKPDIKAWYYTEGVSKRKMPSGRVKIRKSKRPDDYVTLDKRDWMIDEWKYAAGGGGGGVRRLLGQSQTIKYEKKCMRDLMEAGIIQRVVDEASRTSKRLL